MSFKIMYRSFECPTQCYHIKQTELKSDKKWWSRSILKLWTDDRRQTMDDRRRTTDATPWHKLIRPYGPDELKTVFVCKILIPIDFVLILFFFLQTFPWCQLVKHIMSCNPTRLQKTEYRYLNKETVKNRG